MHVARKGKRRNAYRVVVGKFEGKRPLAKLGNWWNYNINVDLKEIGGEGGDWIWRGKG